MWFGWGFILEQYWVESEWFCYHLDKIYFKYFSSPDSICNKLTCVHEYIKARIAVTRRTL